MKNSRQLRTLCIGLKQLPMFFFGLLYGLKRADPCKRFRLDRRLAMWSCLLCLSATPLPGNRQQTGDTFVVEHVGDAHDWHFATIGKWHIVLPLPILLCSRDRGIECFSSAHFYDHHHNSIPFRNYYLLNNKVCCLDAKRSIIDLSITKNIAAMWLSVLLLVGGLIWSAQRYRKVAHTSPKGMVAFIDLIIAFIKDEIAIPNIGQKHYKRFFPYLLTIFCFIWLNNLLGLLPGSANVTGNISVTLVLAAFTICFAAYSGNKAYWQHIFKPVNVPKWLWPVMIPVEILGIVAKFFSLMIRLFANITAGHIILLSIIGLIFSMQSICIGFVVSLPFGTFMFLLKLLVAILQAYVFTLFSAIYFGQAVDEGCH